MLEDSNKGNYEKLTFGIMRSLEKRAGVCDVKLSERQATDRSSLVAWEQKHSCALPDDLRSFYLTSNGMFLKWNVKMNDSRIPVGRLEVNSLDKLIRIGPCTTTDHANPSLFLLDFIADSADESEKGNPHWDHRSRIFELDPCDGYGKVCLVYRNTAQGLPAQRSEIWFLDRSLRWHPLAETFLSYYRMMLMHLGLPQWQYGFTAVGLSPQAEQWLQMYCPLRFGMDCKHFDVQPQDSESSSPNAVDISRLFRGKLEKKKSPNPIQQNNKKKPPVSSAKMGASRTAPSQVLKPLR
ncbi:hypothetical protein CAPTEDRAFT_228643 [Capitella teleta]|uniref:Knr4/Smi1-like domain-containing protein n=1 Tax=Capitella teleta TaxID=283909 RepID=R7VAX2_CAPTE|nr:hypothetical protein CAPTEDRAFT_228643 [Capitella teleta]|eukprot:ELU13486.1 hypothetical protein CAPTEDRAFT_228643 [Capitella teleta]